MHTQRRYATCLGMSKKREIAPDPKRKKRKESDGAYKGVHTPSTKKISTHLHILIKVYDLFLLQIRFLTQQNMRSRYTFKSSIPTAPKKIAIRDRLRKKGVIKSLGKEITHIERSERSSEELYKFILKILQNLRIDG